MKEVKIFIVEDEPILVEQLRIQLEEMDYWVVGNADRGEVAISRIISIQPDVVIMDINIKGSLSGIDVGLELNINGYKGGIIFLTSLDDDSVFDAARDVLPFDYLVKPVGKRKLRRTLELLTSTQNTTVQTTNEVVVLKGKNELYKIAVSDIITIEVCDKQCLITVDGKQEPISIRIGLSELMEKLLNQLLFKVHRSFIVNEKYIDSYDITMNQISLGEIIVPVSRSFKSEVLNRMK